MEGKMRIRKCLLILFSLLIVGMTMSVECLAQEYPKRIGYVNDYAWTLKPEERQILEKELKDFNGRTGFELVVVTVPNLRETEIGAYTSGLAKKWEVGFGNNVRGMVFLMATAERSVGVQVGTDLEQLINNSLINQIAVRDIFPQFKSCGIMSKGIFDGVHSIMRVIEKKK